MHFNQINQELRRRQAVKPQVDDMTIARALDGMLIRCKIARPLPAERNRPDVIEKRVEYANWFSSEAKHSNRSCYANLQLSRTIRTIVNLHSMTCCYA